MTEQYIIVDVGCIECGEQTEVRGIYDSKEEAEKGFERLVKELGIENWEPRGSFLEFLGLHEHTRTTYLGGTGYFTSGQHALEVHVFPPREIEKESNETYDIQDGSKR